MIKRRIESHDSLFGLTKFRCENIIEYWMSVIGRGVREDTIKTGLVFGTHNHLYKEGVYMRLKLIVSFVSLLCLLAIPAFSAEKIDGTWLTEAPAQGGPGGGPGGGGGFGGGQGGKRTMTFVFKADGKKLTGKFTGFAGNTNDIVDGKIKDNKLTFAVKTSAGQGRSLTLEFEGKVKGDEFDYTMKINMGGGGGGGFGGGGGMPPQKYVAKRQ